MEPKDFIGAKIKLSTDEAENSDYVKSVIELVKEHLYRMNPPGTYSFTVTMNRLDYNLVELFIQPCRVLDIEWVVV